MKNIVAILFLGLLSFTACNNKNQSMADKNQPPPTFETPEAAVQQAKQDLLEILRGNLGVNLGVDAATVEQAQAGRPIPSFDVDFQQLMQADSNTSFDQLGGAVQRSMVPLMASGKAATVVEIFQGEKGWQISSIGNQEVTEGLNSVQAATGAAEADVRVFMVPNLNATVFAVNTSEGTFYHTDYEGKFSLRQGVRADTLLAVLSEDARVFFREYGDLLKKQELVK